MVTGRVIVLRGDAASLPLPDCSIDAVVCDPPYALPGGFMGREWDAFESPRMFQGWCESWARECLRVLKPGGYLLAFGGTRTWHRLACAVEDAGFDIRDSVADLTGQDAPGLMWVYGSGFPKSLDVSKAIDRQRHDNVLHVTAYLRERRGAHPLGEIVRHLGFAGTNGTHGVAAFFSDDPAKARVPSMAHWVALKELLTLDAEMDAEVQRLNDRKGTPSDEWSSRPAADYAGRPGMAESWRDGKGWTGSDARGGETVRADAARWEGWGTALKPGWEPIALGRKPLAGTVAQNVLEHGTGALNIDGCRVGTPDYLARTRNTALGVMNDDGWQPKRQESAGNDAGRWPPNVLLGQEAAAEMDRQRGRAGAFAPVRGSESSAVAKDAYGQRGRVPGAFHADEGGASRFFPVFRYEAKADASERPRLADGTAWPTVKPVALMQWLVRLVTPPGGTVGDFFCGTGTTGQACVIEGFNAVLIDKDPQAIALTRVRLAKPVQPALFSDLEAS